MDVLDFPIVNAIAGMVRTPLSLLNDTLAQQMSAEGWNPLPSPELEIVEEYLQWRLDHFDPTIGPDPTALERVQDFKRRDWPQMRIDVVARLAREGEDAVMGQEERRGFEEALESAREAKHELGEVASVLEALGTLVEEAEYIRRRERA